MIKKIFLNKTDVFPTLYMDMVFVESIRPILFTCTDEDGQLYICSCCYASGDKCVWIIVNTTLDNVIALLKNECEIWDMFGHNERIAVVTKCNGNEYPEIQSFDLHDIPKEFLPTRGYCMDAEDGEFDEELKVLKTRLDNAHEYEISIAYDSFYAMVQTIYANIKLDISAIVPEDEYLETKNQVAFATGA